MRKKFCLWLVFYLFNNSGHLGKGCFAKLLDLQGKRRFAPYAEIIIIGPTARGKGQSIGPKPKPRKLPTHKGQSNVKR